MRVLDSGAVAIEDLGSTNGTYVNDERAEGATPVNPGDIVRFGTRCGTSRRWPTTVVRGPRADIDADPAGSVMVKPADDADARIVEGPEREQLTSRDRS